MRSSATVLAPFLVLFSVSASVGQTADGPAAPPTSQACASPAPRFIRFELTDGVGAILVNPSMVAAVQASAEKKDWSQIRWADGHTSLVQGEPEAVSQKLARPASNP